MLRWSCAFSSLQSDLVHHSTWGRRDYYPVMTDKQVRSNGLLPALSSSTPIYGTHPLNLSCPCHASSCLSSGSVCLFLVYSYGWSPWTVHVSAAADELWESLPFFVPSPTAFKDHWNHRRCEPTYPQKGLSECARLTLLFCLVYSPHWCHSNLSEMWTQSSYFLFSTPPILSLCNSLS